jgi:centromere protein V
MVTHKGGCHCGAVRFEVTAPAAIRATRCNCSICAKSGYLHLIVPKGDFTLLSGEDSLTVYRFNTGVARHPFCKVCGIKSFYTPRSHPDGISVNLNCLDPGTVTAVEIRDFDGANWEAAMASRPPAV